MLEHRQLSLSFGPEFSLPTIDEGVSAPLDQLVSPSGAWGSEANRDSTLPAEFFAPRAKADEPRMIRLLDAIYAANLSLDETFSHEQKIARRDDLVAFYRDTRDVPMIKVYGSARDRVWNDSLEEFCDELARLSVATGLSLGNGGGATGAMGRTIHAWERHKAEYAEQGGETAAKIILVPLTFFEETFEAPIEGINAVMGPASTALQLRTTLLHAIGDTVGSLYFPGGLGTNEELGGDLVARQMRRVISTVHSHRETLGKAWLLNTEVVPGQGGFWDGAIEQLGMFCSSGATNEEDQMPIGVLDLRDPRADARRVIDEAVRCRDTDGCQLPTA